MSFRSFPVVVMPIFTRKHMVRHLPLETVRLAVSWRREGRTQEIIGRWLCVSQGSVSKVHKRYRETGQCVQMRCRGQPRISTPREGRMSRNNCLLSATMLRSIWTRSNQKTLQHPHSILAMEECGCINILGSACWMVV